MVGGPLPLGGLPRVAPSDAGAGQEDQHQRTAQEQQVEEACVVAHLGHRDPAPGHRVVRGIGGRAISRIVSTRALRSSWSASKIVSR
jgi:hypothetical protein